MAILRSSEKTILPRHKTDVESTVRTAETLRKQYSGKRDVSELLMQTAVWQQVNAETALEQKGGPSHEALAKHKRSQRFFAAVNKILRSDDRLPSSEKLLQKPKDYGLESEDRDVLTAWLDLQTQVQNALERKYNVLRVDVFRRMLFEKYFKEGEKGTGGYLQLDLVGLQTFNKFGPVIGDIALAKVALFCKNFLQQETKIAQPELSVGRKGDEFYLFAPNIPAEQVAKAFAAYYHAKKDELFVEVPEEGTGGTEKKPIVFYWRVGDANRGNFDQLSETIENKIEEAKAASILQTIEEIQNSIHGHEEEFINLLQYVLIKRIPLELVERILISGANVFSELIADQQNVQEKVVALRQLLQSKELLDLLKHALERVASNDEKDIAGKVVHVS